MHCGLESAKFNFHDSDILSRSLALALALSRSCARCLLHAERSACSVVRRIVSACVRAPSSSSSSHWFARPSSRLCLSAECRATFAPLPPPSNAKPTTPVWVLALLLDHLLDPLPRPASSISGGGGSLRWLHGWPAGSTGGGGSLRLLHLRSEVAVGGIVC